MPTSQPVVSVVVPCFNEEGAIRELHARLRAEFARLEIAAESIYIDDGSTDQTRAILRELAAEDPACRVLAFRCNCGKATALQAGFRVARGGYIITLDADLQDDPAEIPRFLEALQQADLVCGWKAQRHDPLSKTLPSLLYNATVRHFTDLPLHDMNCGFKGYRRAVLDEITLYGELHRYIPVLAAARGFRISELPVVHHPRRSGVSKYGWERFARGFFDLLTVVYLTRYRTRPLHFWGGLGAGCTLVGLAFGLSLSAYFSSYRGSMWHLFLWLVTISLLIVGPLLVALGLLAEGATAALMPQASTPPIVEQLNIPGNDEVNHAG